MNTANSYNTHIANSNFSYSSTASNGNITASSVTMQPINITVPNGMSSPVFTVGNSTAHSTFSQVRVENLTVSQDIKFGNRSLVETLQNIEQRLCMLSPNCELEETWAELKALGDRYRELEQNLIEKEKMWRILKTP